MRAHGQIWPNSQSKLALLPSHGRNLLFTLRSYQQSADRVLPLLVIAKMKVALGKEKVEDISRAVYWGLRFIFVWEKKPAAGLGPILI